MLTPEWLACMHKCVVVDKTASIECKYLPYLHMCIPYQNGESDLRAYILSVP